MSEWISVEDHLPGVDTKCIVWNQNRPFSFYIANYVKHIKQFEIRNFSAVHIQDQVIPFCATHWILIPPTPAIKG